MQQVSASVCRYCGSEMRSPGAVCMSCGRDRASSSTVLGAHVAKTAARNKRTASKLFWLGLIITFIGCFLTTSQQIELSGDLVVTVFAALVHAGMVYMAGLVPAALNSFNPPFLGEDIGMTSKVIIFGACALLIWACRYFARAKGRPDALGFLGALVLIGVIILVIIPTKQNLKY